MIDVDFIKVDKTDQNKKIFPEVNLEEGFVKIILPEFAEIK